MSDDEGGGEWQWYFIPKHVALPAYPSPEAITARLEAAAERQEMLKNHWDSLPDEHREAQDRTAKQFIQDLVLSLVDRIPELAEDSRSLHAFAPGAAPCTDESHGPAVRLLRDTLTSEDILGSVAAAELARWGVDIEPGRELHVYQARVALQQRNPSCGYYALHFALAYASLVTTRDPAMVARLVPMLHDRLHFWRHYDLMNRHLKSHPSCATAVGFPWQPKVIAEGVMEREYMSFLAQHLLEEGLVPSAARLLCLPEAASVLGLGSHTQLARFAAVVEDFRSGRASVVVICLGIINHWVTLACTRSGGRVECVLLDSLNNYILDADDEQIWKVVLEYIFDRRRRKKKVNRAEEYLFYCQMREIRAVCQHIVGLLLGSQDILPQWYGNGVDTILTAFERTAMGWPGPVTASHHVDKHAAVPGGPCRAPHAPCAYHAAAAAAAGVPVSFAASAAQASEHQQPAAISDTHGHQHEGVPAQPAVEAPLALANGELPSALAKGTCISPEMLSAFLDVNYHPRLIEEYIVDRKALGLSLPPGPRARLHAWVCGLEALSRTDDYQAIKDHAPCLDRFLATLSRIKKARVAVEPVSRPKRRRVRPGHR